MSKCSWPDCNEEGTFPAPKNPRDLRGRQYFCQAHIKEFNKNWDGLKGFNENELWGIQSGSTVWKRPVWAEGLNGVHGAKVEVKPFATAQDLFGFFQQRIKAEKNRKSEEQLPSTASLPADVKEACAIFSIPEPLPMPELKPRYLNLVKKNHPDVNKTAEAAEYIKKINVAYQILTEFSERRA
jgi:hypothetical protein